MLYKATFGGVFFNLAEARAAARDVSGGSSFPGGFVSLGRVAILETVEFDGGGGGGGGGTLDMGDGCCCWGIDIGC